MTYPPLSADSKSDSEESDEVPKGALVLRLEVADGRVEPVSRCPATPGHAHDGGRLALLVRDCGSVLWQGALRTGTGLSWGPLRLSGTAPPMDCAEHWGPRVWAERPPRDVLLIFVAIQFDVRAPPVQGKCRRMGVAEGGEMEAKGCQIEEPSAGGGPVEGGCWSGSERVLSVTNAVGGQIGERRGRRRAGAGGIPLPRPPGRRHVCPRGSRFSAAGPRTRGVGHRGSKRDGPRGW